MSARYDGMIYEKEINIIPTMPFLERATLFHLKNGKNIKNIINLS